VIWTGEACITPQIAPSLDFSFKNAYNTTIYDRKDVTAVLRKPIHREARAAESALFDPDEGQWRSGGGNTHGTLPVTGGQRGQPDLLTKALPGNIPEVNRLMS
jgi:hypothetical protein